MSREKDLTCELSVSPSSYCCWPSPEGEQILYVR